MDNIAVEEFDLADADGSGELSVWVNLHNFPFYISVIFIFNFARYGKLLNIISCILETRVQSRGSNFISLFSHQITAKNSPVIYSD